MQAYVAQVRSMWRSRRAKWRQLTKVAETVSELAVRLSEFRAALITDSTFVGCGATWQVPQDCHSALCPNCSTA